MTTTTKVPIVGDLTDDQLFALAARWARAWIGQTGSDPIVDEDDLSQEISRIHRIGQDADSVLVQHVVLDGSIDARLASTLVAKQAVADKALDVAA